MSASDKQIAANRVNGRKSQGPKDTTLTRTNASKHGLSAAGVTALDSAEGFRTMLSDWKRKKILLVRSRCFSSSPRSGDGKVAAC